MKTGKNSVIGIDFGTTNTAVVRISTDESGQRSSIEYLGENGNNQPFASIIAIPREGGKLVFGRQVKEKRLELSETHYIIPSLKPISARIRRLYRARTAIRVRTLPVLFSSIYARIYKRIIKST